MFYVYKITNLINNKIYIGQTNNPGLRWSQHKSAAKYNHTEMIITRAISKYKKENFTFEVIATAKTLEDVNILEEELIIQYNSRDLSIGYNIDMGGNNSVRSPETIEKVSKALKEYYKTHDGTRKGVKLSDELKAKLSEVAMGKPGTNNGKKFSEEHKEKISKAQIGKEHFECRRFSEEVEKEICRLYVEEGCTAYKLEKKYKASRSLILEILKRNNIKSRNLQETFAQRISLENKEKICELYKTNKYSYQDIGDMYKLSRKQIALIISRNNKD